MWRLDVSAEAEVEIFEAALRYEREKSGLGLRFESDLERVFTRLADNPLQFPQIEAEARRALLRRFPYGVFFTASGNVVTVLAVLHLHRHPDTWKDRDRA
jgi:plasmid stabilization system protein ParE